MKYIASFSGGKDSMATIILAHEYGEPLDEIIFAEVMFNEETSGEMPEHMEFIHERCAPLFRKWGYEFKIIRAGNTYMDCFNHVIENARNNPENEGKRAGFPMAGRCVINRDCKVKPIQEFLNQYNLDEITQYIGIAIDEPVRLQRLKGTNKKSLLAKYGYTEEMAYELCKKYGLLSPIYGFANRGGCWFCPNAGYQELKHLRTEYRNLWDKLLNLENEENLIGNIWNTLNGKSMKSNEEMFRLEDAQLTIFNFC